MNVRIFLMVAVVSLLMIFVFGCTKVEKISGELKIIDEPVGDDILVEKVVIPEDGLDSALLDLEEFEGNSSG